MGTLDRIRHYRLRRDRILQGKFNCIPWPFQRFKNYVPGTEKGKYIIITANQKVGKSKLADYIYVYNIILFAIEHPEIKFKIIYFTLEMSASSKKDEFLSFLLNYLDNIQISPTDLNSVDNEKPVDEEILALLESEKYKLYIDKFDEIVTYIDEKTAAIDSLIQKKEQLITELEAYKKSLIYEYVTGKKEVPVHAH